MSDKPANANALTVRCRICEREFTVANAYARSKAKYCPECRAVVDEERRRKAKARHNAGRERDSAILRGVDHGDRDERREEQESARSRETFADILADLRKCAQCWKEFDERIKDSNLREALKMQTEIYSILADRIEATARHAYNEIDRAVRETGRVNAEGVELIRTAMDNTIGEYCE